MIGYGVSGVTILRVWDKILEQAHTGDVVMPVYAYECTECGVRFERRQSFSDDPITVCPECEGKVRRLIQPVGIVFKGSGFYVTDNRSSSNSLLSSKSDSGTAKSTTETASAEKKTDSDTTTTKAKKKVD